MKVHVIDLEFQGRSGTIAAFLVETDAGPVLVESGPSSTFSALKAGLRAAGLQPADIGHVFLSHIHFDHAGAAWRLAQEGAHIHVHPAGAPHLADPEVLWQSAQRIFGDAMENLWGEMRPVPVDQLHACEDGAGVEVGDLIFRAWHTPGHAKHHIAWQAEDAVFGGDVAGVALGNGPVQPPCPPPDIDLPAWKRSIERVRRLEPRELYLTHFGSVSGDIGSHLDDLEAVLEEWCGWVESRLDGESVENLIPRFETYVAGRLSDQGVSPDRRADYERVNPAFMSVQGLARHLRRRERAQPLQNREDQH